jgi:hypothetical protein
MSVTSGEKAATPVHQAVACDGGHGSSAVNTRALVIGFMAAVCGVTVAAVLALLAALVAALLHVEAVGIFTISGSTFGGSLTVEIGLAGLYAVLRRRAS